MRWRSNGVFASTKQSSELGAERSKVTGTGDAFPEPDGPSSKLNSVVECRFCLVLRILVLCGSLPYLGAIQTILATFLGLLLSLVSQPSCVCSFNTLSKFLIFIVLYPYSNFFAFGLDGSLILVRSVSEILFLRPAPYSRDSIFQPLPVLILNCISVWAECDG